MIVIIFFVEIGFLVVPIEVLAVLVSLAPGVVVFVVVGFFEVVVGFNVVGFVVVGVIFNGVGFETVVEEEDILDFVTVCKEIVFKSLVIGIISVVIFKIGFSVVFSPNSLVGFFVLVVILAY